jgi:hypothetical protein
VSRVDVLGAMDVFAAMPYAMHGVGGAAEARAAVAELIVKAEAAAQILHNAIAAKQISEGYRPHLDELNAALANIVSAP